MTDRQKEAMRQLRNSAWHVGWTFGYEGCDTVRMLAQVSGEMGGAPSQWVARLLLAGHAEGERDRLEDGRVPADLVPAGARIADDVRF